MVRLDHVRRKNKQVSFFQAIWKLPPHIPLCTFLVAISKWGRIACLCIPVLFLSCSLWCNTIHRLAGEQAISGYVLCAGDIFSVLCRFRWLKKRAFDQILPIPSVNLTIQGLPLYAYILFSGKQDLLTARQTNLEAFEGSVAFRVYFSPFTSTPANV